MSGCNWKWELTQYLSNTCQMHYIYAIYGCKCYSKKYRWILKKNIDDWMAAATFVKQRNTATWKKLFLATKRSNLQWKMNFRNKYFGSQPFLMSCYFTKIFVHLPIIGAVCYFSVYKLIEWDLANIYLFKVNSKNARKRYKIWSKLTIDTVESRSGFFTAKCFCCWLWTDNACRGVLSCEDIIIQSLKTSRCFI